MVLLPAKMNANKTQKPQNEINNSNAKFNAEGYMEIMVVQILFYNFSRLQMILWN